MARTMSACALSDRSSERHGILICYPIRRQALEALFLVRDT